MHDENIALKIPSNLFFLHSPIDTVHSLINSFKK